MKGSSRIEINNLTRSKIDESFLQRVTKRVLTGEKKQNGALSIALVMPKKARELNLRYRKKNKVANVLSFPAGNDNVPRQSEEYLGEIILCPQQIKKEAKKYGIISETATAWMLIHGILHIVGYDHIKERDTKTMEQKELFYLSGL